MEILLIDVEPTWAWDRCSFPGEVPHTRRKRIARLRFDLVQFSPAAAGDANGAKPAKSKPPGLSQRFVIRLRDTPPVIVDEVSPGPGLVGERGKGTVLK